MINIVKILPVQALNYIAFCCSSISTIILDRTTVFRFKFIVSVHILYRLNAIRYGLRFVHMNSLMLKHFDRNNVTFLLLFASETTELRELLYGHRN